MAGFNAFVAKFYILFLIFAVMMVFSLIGYFHNKKKEQSLDSNEKLKKTSLAEVSKKKEEEEKVEVL